MKKRGFTAGLCTGAMLLCGISAGVADLTAQLSQQPIHVDGERVWDVTAYDIGGNNYVKLRDMGMSVGFDVVYDASTDSVHIDPTTPYRESIKKQSYASAPEQNPQQDYFTGYATEEDARDAIFKRATEETAKAQQNSVNQTHSLRKRQYRLSFGW